MQRKTARLFANGGSQAVRLPAEFRFEGDEVFVRKDERTGDVILSKKAPWATWQSYLRLRGGVPGNFMAERPLNQPAADRNLFDDES